MKIRSHQAKITPRSTGLAVAALALFFATSGTAMAQCTACVNAVTLPTGNVTFSSIAGSDDPQGDPASSGNGYFTLNLTGTYPGSDLDAGPYTAWCGAWYSSIVQNTGTPGAPVLSTYSPSVPVGMKPLVPGNTLNMVNYILNHKVGTVQDVQDAIWLIMVGSTDLAGPASPTAVALANAAITNGAAYVPNSFGTMAVFYVTGPTTLATTYQSASNQLQTLFFEVPVPLANNSTPTLACASSSGQAGTSYSSALVANGGVSPYLFSVAGGALPPGLFLNPSAGTITGVASTSGSFSYTAQAVDSSGNSATNTVTSACSITISQPVTPLALVCPANLTGQVGVSYSSALVASGGTGNYSYSLAAGSILPSGLTLNASTGFIAGTPLLPGSVTFTGKVTDTGDSALAPVSATCGISIVGPPSANCVSISAVQGRAITPVTVTGSNGAGGSYTFSATGLPAGLSMASNGTISGTPTVTGTFPYIVTVTDRNGNTGTTTCSSVTVTTAPTPLTLVCASSIGQVSVPYSGPLVAGGGSGNYAFSITGGSLPLGLSLNTSTGLISGTPTSAGTFSFTARVVDTTDSVLAPATSTCGITVAAVPSTTCAVISATQGVAITPVTLSGANGAGGTYTFTATGLPSGLVMSTSGTISGTPSVNGTFSYTVRVADRNGNAGTITCSVTAAPPVVVTAGAVGTGDTATIGFWQNKNGQYLISIANGGGTSTALANWLATQMPALFGATSANNLTGKKNSDVAALFTTLFKVSGTKTNAQVMASALAVYITSTSLSGTDALMVAQRTKFRFNSSTGGTGVKTWNVGSYGTAIGLVNNQSYTVLQLLAQANLRKQLGTFDSNAFNVIFDGINVKGDII